MTILIVLASIVAFILIVALFVKKEYFIQREIIIQKSREEVFDYIRYLKNQENYSKWVRTDPNMKKVFSGTDGAVGFIYAWEGNKKAGKGEQEIKRIEEGVRIDMEIRFEKPFKGIAQAFMSAAPSNANSALIKWGMKGGNPYPLNLMHLFVEGMLGKDMEASLQDLKRILEKGQRV